MFVTTDTERRPMSLIGHGTRLHALERNKRETNKNNDKYSVLQNGMKNSQTQKTKEKQQYRHYESRGRMFESCRVHHISQQFSGVTGHVPKWSCPFVCPF